MFYTFRYDLKDFRALFQWSREELHKSIFSEKQRKFKFRTKMLTYMQGKREYVLAQIIACFFLTTICLLFCKSTFYSKNSNYSGFWEKSTLSFYLGPSVYFIVKDINETFIKISLRTIIR